MISEFNKNILSFLLVMSCFFLAYELKAQEAPKPGGAEDTNTPPPPGFPIDGGLSYLLQVLLMVFTNQRRKNN